jgi:hypothetical protein
MAVLSGTKWLQFYWQDEAWRKDEGQKAEEGAGEAEEAVGAEDGYARSKWDDKSVVQQIFIGRANFTQSKTLLLHPLLPLLPLLFLPSSLIP